VQSGGSQQSIFDDAAVPRVAAAADDQAVQLGVRFETAVAGDIVGIKFYKSAHDAGPYSGTLWNADGQPMAQAQFTATDGAGWKQASVPPVPVVAGRQYVASYRAPAGHYAADQSMLGPGRVLTRGPLTALTGVFSYGNDMPTQTWNNTNYYVDVVFVPHAGPGGAAVAGPSPTMPTLRDVDGGANFYAGFADGLPSTPEFFPIGVWYESVTQPADIAIDRAAGLNTYVELTDSTDLSLINAAGMQAIWAASLDRGITAGRLTSDEVDMWAGPGTAAWTGNYPGQGDICVPADERCGYTVMEQLVGSAPPGKMRFTNYGKGVTFWESDAEAGRFVNDYQEVVSADNYWFTDPGICAPSQGGALVAGGNPLAPGECRLAANYGATVERLRGLVRPVGSKPVWNFVEVGHPFTDPSAPSITGPQIRAAVWSGLIHGARGVIYFNHSFGGSCISQHVLRDACGESIRDTVTTLNHQITRLAPVLNAPFLDGYASTDGAVDVAAKMLGDNIYLLAGSRQLEPGTADFRLSCGDATAVTVVDEDRTIAVRDGAFSDTFADGNAVHIYLLPGAGSACGIVH